MIRRALAVIRGRGPFVVGKHHSFALSYLRKLTCIAVVAIGSVLCERSSISHPPVLSLALTGGFLVFVMARRPATTFYPRRRKAARPMPYASMTLSGSRNGKQTHLFFGEPNSCPAPRTVCSPSPAIDFRKG
jgi:hypothetical protein